ncbi:MAG TPA: hypothetical protein DCQ29_09780 [Chitinophagaceae bacterium]|nr:hypothetical protein [Chitinophagaceae bacterium]
MIGLIILLFDSALSQKKNLLLKGTITAYTGADVPNCFVKILSTKKNTILHYLNTSDRNSFSIIVSVQKTDTLTIHVSSLGYAKFEQLLTFNSSYKDTLELRIVLQPQYKQLDSVTVKAPPVWKRGDTTFFRVNAFKEGGEKKLKDIIEKIPGFEIIESGQLLYKKKPVEKIMIEGEDVFADQTNLLLNNFPVHVLNNIQAIENQNNNKLLKGLYGDGKVFLNLGLNKTSIKAAFGDGELGIGSGERYTLSPVFFSLYNKIKIGLIANWNNIGNGVSLQQTNELKKENEKNTEGWLMNNYPLQLINNFENRWYIKNNQKDNRFQINTPLSKKVMAKTEINFITDRQSQNSYYNSIFYNTANFIERSDTNNINYTPRMLSIQKSIKWNIDSTKALEVQGNLFRDASNSNQSSIYGGLNNANSLQNNTNNNWNSITLLTSFTHRVSGNKAIEWSVNYNKQSIVQQAVSTSADFPGIFTIPNFYTNLSNIINNKVHHFKSDLRISTKTKEEVTQKGISFSSTLLNINSNSYLQDKNATQSIYQIDNNKNTNNYYIVSLQAFYKKSIQLFFKNPFSVDAAVGFSNARINNSTNVRHIPTPTVNVTMENKHKYSIFDGMLILSYTQNQLASFNLNEASFYPRQTNTYVKVTNTQIPNRILNITYSLAWEGKKNLTSSVLSVTYYSNLTSSLSLLNYKGFLLFQRDSMIQLPTNMYSCNYHYTIPSVALNAVINVDASYTYKTAFLAQGIDNINMRPTSYSFYWIMTNIKKNWKKRYYVRLENSISGYTFNIPNFLGENTPTTTFNFLAKLSQRFILSKTMNLASNISFYNNNLFSDNRAAFTYIDLEWNYRWKESPFHFIIRAENLTNQNRYFNSNNSMLLQSFYSIPLIPRNIFSSLRITF